MITFWALVLLITAGMGLWAWAMGRARAKSEQAERLALYVQRVPQVGIMRHAAMLSESAPDLPAA